MKLATQSATTYPKTNTTRQERARYSCDLAKHLENIGEYEAACEALSEFWVDRNAPPNISGLDLATTAHLLLRTGALAGWLGSADQTNGTQEIAKDLITRSVEIFTEIEDAESLAEAHSDLALCYWREGAFDEARVTLANALRHLSDQTSDLKASILIRSGMIEATSGRFNQAFRFYDDAEAILEQSASDALRGTFHNSRAALLTCLGTAENQEEFRDRALIEYTAASFHFEQAGNHRYLARVENNLGFLFFTLGRYKDAHQHLDRARHFFFELKDTGSVAQVDDTRARTLLAEGRLKEAERYARSAVKTLEKGDECSLLVEALTTHAVTLARMGNHTRARVLLQRAITVAETCGDLEGAARAKLSIIEELSHQTPPRELASIFHSATDLLRQSQDPSATRRLTSSASITIDALLAEIQKETTAPAEESWQGFSIRQEMKKVEAGFIERALRDAGGSVSKAAHLLGFKHHQSLISLLGSRHKNLQDRRSIIRRRRQHLFSQPNRTKRGAQNIQLHPVAQVSIMHVEDHKLIARQIGEMLVAERIHVDNCVNGLTAWEILKTKAPYDALVVDNNLPGLSGLELVLRVRAIPHRRNMPIVMVSGDDCEKEAWRAGVDAFLEKSEAIHQLPLTIFRVIEEKRQS
jgi:tetratricopeptide (TPR) repeat protein/ActR/RegA family two-component response regulator